MEGARNARPPVSFRLPPSYGLTINAILGLGPEDPIVE
jgi:hypothetical protein